MKKTETISLPPRVAFVNINDGSVFFDCHPAEARTAQKMIELMRMKKGRKGDKCSLFIRIAKEKQAAITCTKDFIRGYSFLPGNALTVNVMNMIFTDFEKDDYVVTHIVVNALRYADIRMWGNNVIEIYPPEFTLYFGVFASLWTSDISVSNDIGNDTVVLVSSWKGKELMTPETRRYQVY